MAACAARVDDCRYPIGDELAQCLRRAVSVDFSVDEACHYGAVGAVDFRVGRRTFGDDVAGTMFKPERRWASRSCQGGFAFLVYIAQPFALIFIPFCHIRW
ncbi:hypothetical protein XA68_18413 [Ophiocordyceps unilateralis]|uniref:Uncharacterized protein n=1 Tax=Ophiocordyceps unilateralis TaxID=268505 RepID=A0A2A9PHM0_OPHUN|nr:hypothetical protein XA68_18413 [Ophiocordyceps unilateralis]